MKLKLEAHQKQHLQLFIQEVGEEKLDFISKNINIKVGADGGKPISQMRINFNAGNEVVAGSTYEHLRGQDFEFYPEKNPEDWEKIFLPSLNKENN